jgi:hypothetical protein
MLSGLPAWTQSECCARNDNEQHSYLLVDGARKNLYYEVLVKVKRLTL